jgi:hypothetical protein
MPGIEITNNGKPIRDGAWDMPIIVSGLVADHQGWASR